MGACTSKLRKYHSDHLKNDPSSSKHAKTRKNVNEERNMVPSSSTPNNDQLANVPFIDSEEKCTTPPPPLSPPSPSTDDGEETTVKNNFETNMSYSKVETVEKLKQEVLTFLREKILPYEEEKTKLTDYVLKRIIGDATEKQRIAEYLHQCLNDIEHHQPIDQGNPHNQIKNRLMHIITIYVASQSPDQSFLKALYEKMGASLDLNSLNAETSEHEVVEVTVTKRVRQVYLDGTSADHTHPNRTIIHLSSHNAQQAPIPEDLPEDLRRKAEEVLHNLNDILHSKH